MVARKFTPTKLSQIPSSPKLQREPNTIIGNKSATETDIMVARTGFSMALKKLCVVTATQRKRYARQNSLMAWVEISRSNTSSAFANIDAIVFGKKNKSDVDKRPMVAVPV